MHKAFDASKQAYSSGDGARAKQLSIDGNKFQDEMERKNEEAATWVFGENNKDSPVGTTDLHGLYVAESLRFAESAITVSLCAVERLGLGLTAFVWMECRGRDRQEAMR